MQTYFFVKNLKVILISAIVVLASACSAPERGPYLQNATPNSIIVKWRTKNPASGQVRYGLSADNLAFITPASEPLKDHLSTLTDLQADTTYYYELIADGDAITSINSFNTMHEAGDTAPFRVWLTGDSGRYLPASKVGITPSRDAFVAYNGTPKTDLFIMLGDNAYLIGKDFEYQNDLFSLAPDILASTPVYSTIGNHEWYDQQNLTPGHDYFEIFTLPQDGEAGGIPSGTERYYSFKYGNVHFICLDSENIAIDLLGILPNHNFRNAMRNWLIDDLAANDSDWTVVYFHQPPYSKGTHNSDAASERRMKVMRDEFTPIFDEYGVDLVFGGHSHVYERSYPLVGHTGDSTEFDESMIIDLSDGREDGDGAYEKPLGKIANSGVIYTVAGSTSLTDDEEPKGENETNTGSCKDSDAKKHCVHYISHNLLGSVVLDFDGNRVDATFISPDNGNSEAGEPFYIKDYYTITKSL